MTPRLRARAVVCLSAVMATTGLGLAGSALFESGLSSVQVREVQGEHLGADELAAAERPRLGSEPLDGSVREERGGGKARPDQAAEVSAPGRSSWQETAVGERALGESPLGDDVLGEDVPGEEALGEEVLGEEALGEPERRALHAPLLDALPGDDTYVPPGREEALPPMVDAPPPMAVQLDPIELEILRLTNALRADPSGPLARRKPMPECVDQPFYDLRIDPATGHPEAAPLLQLDEAVSVALARAWASEMDRSGLFEHRSPSSAMAVYGRLGVDLGATGENIAWFSGYTDAEAARVHFEGWRESDDGHYCALVSPTYSHVGVGVYRGEERSWAVQNFYQAR